MPIPLEYEDYHPETGEPEKVRFKIICPRSSGIVKHQSGILNYPGLTVVALITDDNFLKYLDELQKSNCGFTRVHKLHCTLLGLLDGSDSVPTNSEFKNVIYDSVKECIDQKELGGFQLKFDCIRPGTWRGKNKKIVNNCSDGTVIATGNLKESDNRKFIELGQSLAIYLKEELDYIIGPDFTRKFPTLFYSSSELESSEESVSWFSPLFTGGGGDGGGGAGSEVGNIALRSRSDLTSFEYFSVFCSLVRVTIVDIFCIIGSVSVLAICIVPAVLFKIMPSGNEDSFINVPFMRS